MDPCILIDLHCLLSTHGATLNSTNGSCCNTLHRHAVHQHPQITCWRLSLAPAATDITPHSGTTHSLHCCLYLPTASVHAYPPSSPPPRPHVSTCRGDLIPSPHRPDPSPTISIHPPPSPHLLPCFAQRCFHLTTTRRTFSPPATLPLSHPLTLLPSCPSSWRSVSTPLPLLLPLYAYLPSPSCPASSSIGKLYPSPSPGTRPSHDPASYSFPSLSSPSLSCPASTCSGRLYPLPPHPVALALLVLPLLPRQAVPLTKPRHQPQVKHAEGGGGPHAPRRTVQQHTAHGHPRLPGHCRW